MPDNRPEINSRGNRIDRSFFHADRYHFDFHRCKAADGWKQYDTNQDAWYFGVWVNLKLREILTYAEGDITRVTCPSDDHLRAELEAMAEFYGDPPPAAIGYDMDGTRTEYYDPRPEVGKAAQ